MSHRHLARSIAMQILYQWDFRGRPTAALPAIIAQNMAEFAVGLEDNNDYIEKTVHEVVSKIDELDQIIIRYTDNWPIEQMSIVDRNILRIGAYEMHQDSGVPSKVAINEAIELAKNFGGQSSGKFVNGVLGAMYNDVKKKEDLDKIDTVKKEIE